MNELVEDERNTSAFVLPANIITPNQSQVNPRNPTVPRTQPPIQQSNIPQQIQQNVQNTQIMRKTDSDFIIP